MFNTEVEPTTQPAPDGADQTRVRVLLLGSGELERELTIALQRLGAEVIAVDRYADAPAHGVADRSVVAKMTDPDALAAVVEREKPRFVVTATDAVAFDALAAAAESNGAELAPSARSARLAMDREGMRRLAADELGLPTAPFWFAGSVDELTAVAQHAGFPLVVKPVVAVPGQGESVLLRSGDIEPAWRRAVSAGGRITRNRVLAETVVEIDYEITLLTVRVMSPHGPVLHFCEPIGHRQVDGEVLQSWQPQEMDGAALDAAKSIAARIVNALGGCGVFGVELLVAGDEVYFTDLTVRPGDGGLVTLRTQRLSEVELQARAILGLAVDTIMISPGAAEVVYADHKSVRGHAARDDDSEPDLAGVLAEALAVPESEVRVFDHQGPQGWGGSEGYGRRRLGLALATAPTLTTARDRVRQMSAALCKLGQP